MEQRQIKSIKLLIFIGNFISIFYTHRNNCSKQSIEKREAKLKAIPFSLPFLMKLKFR